MSATASGGKSKLFGFLKGIFHKPEEASTVADADAGKETQSASPPPLAESAAEAAPVRTSQPGNGNGKSRGPTSTGRKNASHIALSLSSIVSGLPADLQPKVRTSAVGNATVSIALEKILSQLAQGVVKVPFGDIRQAAPHAFASGAESDRIAISLPLNEIIAQLNPALLVRRPAQKQVEVPADISSPFDGKGNGLVFSVGNAKPVTPAAPRQAVPAPATPARGAISSVPKPTPPPAVLPFTPPKAVSPSVPAAPASPPSQVIPFTPITPKAPTPPAKPAVPPRTPVKPPAPPAATTAASPTVPMSPVLPRVAATKAPPPQSSAPKSVASPTQAMPMKPAAPQPGAVTAKPAIPQPQTAAAISAAPQPVRPPANVETFAVPLDALAESWPEALRQELARLKLEGKNVQLPCDLIENALKGGRAVFPWKSIRSWIQPPPGDSPHDAAELEMPLKVVTPLFFARKNRATKHHQKVSIDESIPNLFFGFPGAETAPPPVGPATTSSAAKAGPIAKPVDTNYYIWDDSSDSVVSDETEFRQKTLGGTDFVARYATPNEIASRAAALDGVAGALIALPDGLMVASRIPAELNGDTLAAFLPQIFAKVNQCTRELRMGELNNLNFTVGNIPWKIFRINAIFFAAFGRAGEPLPTAELTALAAELDRKQR